MICDNCDKYVLCNYGMYDRDNVFCDYECYEMYNKNKERLDEIITLIEQFVLEKRKVKNKKPEYICEIDEKIEQLVLERIELKKRLKIIQHK